VLNRRLRLTIPSAFAGGAAPHQCAATKINARKWCAGGATHVEADVDNSRNPLICIQLLRRAQRMQCVVGTYVHNKGLSAMKLHSATCIATLAAIAAMSTNSLAQTAPAPAPPPAPAPHLHRRRGEAGRAVHDHRQLRHLQPVHLPRAHADRPQAGVPGRVRPGDTGRLVRRHVGIEHQLAARRRRRRPRCEP
jgi:hypothetical protein